MGKKNIARSALAEASNDVYSKLKKATMSNIRTLQNELNLSDQEMPLILGITDKDFSTLMDDRFYYVIKLDTLIRINLLLNKYFIQLEEPDKGRIDPNEFVQRFKTEEIDDSVKRLLITLGLNTAEEIDCFTDFLIKTADKSKVKCKFNL